MHASLEHLLRDKVACKSMDRIQKQPNQVHRCDGLLSEMILGDEAIHHICWKLILRKSNLLLNHAVMLCRFHIWLPELFTRLYIGVTTLHGNTTDECDPGPK